MGDDGIREADEIPREMKGGLKGEGGSVVPEPLPYGERIGSPAWGWIPAFAGQTDGRFSRGSVRGTRRSVLGNCYLGGFKGGAEPAIEGFANRPYGETGGVRMDSRLRGKKRMGGWDP